MKQKFLSSVLTLCILVGLLACTPLTVSAATNGTCGSNLTWSYNNGTLTISGYGSMKDYQASYANIYHAPWYGKTINTVIVEEGVTSIGDYAFWKHDIKDLYLPKSITEFGKSPFYVSTVQNIHVNDLCSWCNSSFESNLLSNEWNLYIEETPVENLVIPQEITDLNNYTFYGCNNIKTVTIHDKITEIKDFTFTKCSNLSQINFPDTIMSIGKSAFANCIALTELFLPSNLTTIKQGAFNNCSGLIAVKLPPSLRKIESSAFSSTTNLSRVYVTDLESWFKIEFGDRNSNPLNYAKNLYIQEQLCNKIIIPNAITEINNYAYAGFDSLTELVIHNNVTKIGNQAFVGCYSLTDVFYTGTEEEWNNINIHSSNDSVINATIHYNYAPPAITVQKLSVNNQNMLQITTTGIPAGSELVLACYQGNSLSYVEPVTKSEEQDVYYFLPTSSYTSAKVLVLENLGTLSPIIEATPVE